MGYDLFISHASEDKATFVHRLVEELQSFGLKVWYDRAELRLGRPLREQIDAGLAAAAHGVIVLSKAFFAKNWPQAELDALHARVMSAPSGQVLLIPVWHGVSQKDVEQFSLLLAPLYAANSGDGVTAVAGSIFSSLRPECDRYARGPDGRYLCRLVDGPLKGEHVLLVDVRLSSEDGPILHLRPGDVIPYIQYEGKQWVAGLARRQKHPMLLNTDDCFSLPTHDATSKMELDSGRLRTAIEYFRYRFSGVTAGNGSIEWPCFSYIGREWIHTRN